MNELLHLPNNIKIHFAGHEQFYNAVFCAKIGIKYGLFSSYPGLCGMLGIAPQPQYIKSNNPWSRNIPKFNEITFKHSIMDSGIFTLAYSREVSNRGIKINYDSWQDAFVDYIQKHNFNGTIVEVDCQSLTTSEYAWKLRKRLRTQLPNHRIINVFHLEDGKKGLDKLIDFSDYIAFASTELTLKRPQDCVKMIPRLIEYTKNKKDDIDIHILGCTNVNILRACRYCTSCDSTSYLASMKFGTVLSKQLRDIPERLRREYLKKYRSIVYDTLKENKDSHALTQRQLMYWTEFCAYTKMFQQRYEVIAGDQS